MADDTPIDPLYPLQGEAFDAKSWEICRILSSPSSMKREAYALDISESKLCANLLLQLR